MRKGKKVKQREMGHDPKVKGSNPVAIGTGRKVRREVKVHCGELGYMLYWPASVKRLVDESTHDPKPKAGNTKGRSITVLLTSCLTGLESAV